MTPTADTSAVNGSSDHNPFILDVSTITVGLTEPVSAAGASPVRWGGTMLAVEEGTPVEVQGTLSNLGEAVMVNVEVAARATGTCTLCLQAIATDFQFTISDVFGFNEDFIQGDEADDDEEYEPLFVEHGKVDITQLVLDEAGLNAPFSPVCGDVGQECDSSIPAPDGVIDASLPVQPTDEDTVDPRWSGLEKFL